MENMENTGAGESGGCDSSVSRSCLDCPSVASEAEEVSNVYRLLRIGSRALNLVDVASGIYDLFSTWGGDQKTDDAKRITRLKEIISVIKNLRDRGVDEALEHATDEAVEYTRRLREGCSGPVRLSGASGGVEHVVLVCGSPDLPQGELVEPVIIYRESAVDGSEMNDDGETAVNGN